MSPDKIVLNIFYSLPVHLLILQVKRLHFHFILWLVLFGFATQGIGKKYGIPYLFLDPEYLGRVDFLSFCWLGAGYGGFFIAYNITSYILYSRHFPFLGGLKRPFSKFVLNNSVIPLLFLIVYLTLLVRFQLQSEFQAGGAIVLHIVGFLTGFIALVLMSSLYFYFTNTDIFRMLRLKIKRSARMPLIRKIALDKDFKWQKISPVSTDTRWKVDYYLSSPFHARRAMEASSYEHKSLKKVLDHNQMNAVFIELIVLMSLVLLGIFRDISYFQLPAGTSVLVVFSMIVMLSGAFSFWLKGWQVTVLILLIIFFNYITRFETLKIRSAAYGIDYSKISEYSEERLRELSSAENYEHDTSATIAILENWKKKVSANLPPGLKPKLVMTAASGGGHRAALFCLRILQTADSITDQKLFNHTVLISGASGGVIGASYFREVYMRHLSDQAISPYHEQYLDRIAKDMLNPIAFSIAVNDIFFPFQKFRDRGNTYLKDRAYALEKALNDNTENVLSKRLGEYRQAEASAVIPMIIYTPTVINDGRKLYISPQDVSYLTTDISQGYPSHIDGIEFRRLFAKSDPDSLRITSAMRMSATFPYITPNTSLPSTPVMQVNDAGVRDNLGAETALKFLYVFRHWIKENTGGVILIQIRDTPLDPDIKKIAPPSIAAKLLKPVAGFYSNWERFMQYEQENLFEYLKNTTGIPCRKITFQYIPENSETEASLSWHLTSREKLNVAASVYHAENRKALNELRKLLE